MKLLITNSIERNDYLIEALNMFNDCNQVSIASPFFSDNEFINTLVNNNCKIRLIVRLCTATSYSALNKIIDRDNVSIKFFVDKHFHSKIYIIDNSFIIVGSSNFTNGGLKNNFEINIGIPQEDERFNELEKLFEVYWEMANPLTSERLEKFKEIIGKSKEQIEEVDRSITKDLQGAFNSELSKPVEFSEKDILTGKKKSRILTEEHKRKISESNKGKGRKEVSEEHIKLLNEAARASLSKPVVCLNTGEHFTSIKDASISIYGTNRGHSYISEVCRGGKTHYLRQIWRYEDDYNKLTETEIKNLIDNLNSKFESKKITKMVRKLLYKDKIYDSNVDLSKDIIKDGRDCNFRIISSLISQAESNNCSFIRMKIVDREETIFFANYEQIYSGNVLIEEDPVESSLDQLRINYERIFNYKIGDASLQDLLISKQKVFYKFEGQYYKSKFFILRNLAYDETLSKKDIFRLMREKNYEFLWEATPEEIYKSSKSKYYLKNNKIFRNVQDYVDKYIQEISKEEVLIELGISW